MDSSRTSFSIIFGLAILLLFSFTFVFANGFQNSANPAANAYTTLCSSLPLSDAPAGIYAVSGGALVEDNANGNLDFCGGGNSRTVATNPISNTQCEYNGMGGISTKADGLVLALSGTNCGAGDYEGFWLCYHASATGCTTTKYFILPSSFCSTEPGGFCAPVGIALDSSLNVYYADSGNQKLVECLASSYTSCSNLPASSAFVGFNPWGLFLKGSTIYVSDGSCAGKVWEGTKSSLHVIYTEHEGLDSITASTNNPSKTLHVYVGFDGGCKHTGPKVVDLTDGKTLPGPKLVYPDGGLYGLDPSLQFTLFQAHEVIQSKDTK